MDIAALLKTEWTTKCYKKVLKIGFQGKCIFVDLYLKQNFLWTLFWSCLVSEEIFDIKTKRVFT